MKPDYSKTAVFHPDKKPVFEELDSQPTFEPGNPNFSLANAWWLSNAAHLAYYCETEITTKLNQIGLELVEYFDEDGTQAYLAKGKAFAVLAFRGTEIDEFKDTATNVNIPLVTFEKEAKVHKGFLCALDKVWEKVNKRLSELNQDGYKIWYTGHSLGAALATLTALHVKPFALYTYGSPMVGNEAFTKLIDQVVTARFVNCSDIVPRLPSRVFGYAHTHELYLIKPKEGIVKNPKKLQVLHHRISGIIRYFFSFAWLKAENVKLRSLADHAIMNYTAGIWSELKKTSYSKL